MGKTSSVNKNRYELIVAELFTTYLKKNNDYGNAFEQSLDEDGLLVSKIRLGDKQNRFKTLIKNDAEVSDESIRDTLMDMANYAIMTVMWMDGKDLFKIYGPTPDGDELISNLKKNVKLFGLGNECENRETRDVPVAITVNDVKEALSNIKGLDSDVVHKIIEQLNAEANVK